MNCIFYSYYIELLLKGKLKAVQVSLCAVVTFLVILPGISGIINFITGRSNDRIDSLFMLLFIYSLMNLGYTVFSRYTPSLVVAEIKGNNLLVQKSETEPEKSSDTAYSILKNKNYGSGIKSSPKAVEIRSKEAAPKGLMPIKSVRTANTKIDKGEPSAPELEINIESTQEFFEEEKEAFNNLYSGVIDGNYTVDIIDITEIIHKE